MKISAVKETVVKLSSRPVFIWGPPGIGKSSIVHQAAQVLGIDIIDIRSVLLDPVDLRGIPQVKNGRTTWCPPIFLPKDGKGILFLDELPQAPMAVQASLLQLTLDRKIGEYNLPDGWRIVAAGNRVEDRAGSQRVITPLLNRFVHLELEVSTDDWLSWAALSIVPEVRSYIAFRPSQLFDFKPGSADRAFPTPRSWEMVSDIVKQGLDHYDVIAGAVGPGAASEFCGFLRVYRGLPNIDEMIQTPATCRFPTEPSVLFALVGALADRARTANTKELAAIFTIAGRLQPEYAVMLTKDIVAVKPSSLATPEAVALLKKYNSIILGT